MAVKFGSILELNNATKEATLDANNLRGTTIQVDEFNSASLATIGFGLTTAPGKRRLGTIVATTGSLTAPVKYYAFISTGSGDSNLSGSEWTDLSNWEEIMLSSNTGSFLTESPFTATSISGAFSGQTGSFLTESPFTAAGISGSWQSQHFQLSSGTASLTNITASGDITASRVRANVFLGGNGKNLIQESYTSGHLLSIGNNSTSETNVRGLKTTLQGDLNVLGLFPLADGHISASGNIQADGNISSSGNLFANLSDANGSYNNTVVYDTTSGQFYYTGSYGSGGGGSDNLGNHTATQDLDLGSFDINKVNTITLGDSTRQFVSSSGTTLLIGDDNYWDSISYGRQIVDKHLFTGSIVAEQNITASAGILANDLTIERMFQPDFDPRNDPHAGGWVSEEGNGLLPGVPLFEVKPGISNQNAFPHNHRVNITLSGSNDTRLYRDPNNGATGPVVGTYSPPTTGVAIEATTDQFTVTGGIGTRTVVVDISGDFGNLTVNNLTLKKIEANGNLTGTSVFHRNLTIGGQLLVTRYGGSNTFGAFQEVWNSSTPTTNPWTWGTWVPPSTPGDYTAISATNGEVETVFTLNGSPPSIIYRLTFEYNDPDIANNDGTAGKGFFIGDPSERRYERQDNYIAQIVNIDNRPSIGNFVQGLKITLGRPYGAPLVSPGANDPNNIQNFYLKCEEANTTGIENKGGIAPDPNGVGLYLYGSDYSDERLKENITLSEDGLNIVQKLKVKKFNFIGSDRVERGLIAQEVQEIIPEAVISGMKHLELKWNKITPYLIKAIQQQQDQIENLQTQIDELKQLIK